VDILHIYWWFGHNMGLLVTVEETIWNIDCVMAPFDNWSTALYGCSVPYSLSSWSDEFF
jgi:hypothetical protein